MSKYIEEYNFPLLPPELYSDKLCRCGSGLRISKDPRPRNTAYIDTKRNWLPPCCDACFANDWNYYVDAWHDYYGVQ